MSTLDSLDTIGAPEHARPVGGAAPRTSARLAERRSARIGLAGAPVALALVFNLWTLDRNGWTNVYYAAAARSMASSWHNFLFGSFDPGGFITVDKPPFALWVQALTVRVFGYNSWSLLVPSALAGAAAVWLLSDTIRRVWGRWAGFAAGLALALTPITVAVSRHNNPDSIMVMLVVLGAWSIQRAVESGRMRWLLLTGFAGGLAFLAKMLAAYIVLPALWLAYLVASRRPWKVRIGHLAAASAVLLVTSASWIALVDLTPASSRPYMGGSTNNTARDLLFGYNGFGRVTGEDQGFGGGPGGGGGRGGFPRGGFGGGGFNPGGFGGTNGAGTNAPTVSNGLGGLLPGGAPAASSSATNRTSTPAPPLALGTATATAGTGNNPPANNAASNPPANNAASNPPANNAASNPPANNAASNPPANNAASNPPANNSGTGGGLGGLLPGGTAGTGSTGTGSTGTGNPGGFNPGGFGPGGFNPGGFGRGGFGGGQGGPGGGVSNSFGGNPGLTRFFNASLADQILWLTPLGVLGAAIALLAVARRRRLDAKLGSVVMWGGWFLISAIVFSKASGIFHPYYVSLTAPGVAGMIGVSVGTIRSNEAGRRITGLVAAVAVALTAWMEVWLLGRANYTLWLRPILIVVAAVVSVALIGGALIARLNRPIVRSAAIAAGIAAFLVGPGIWSAQALRYPASGTFPSARPTGVSNDPFGPGGNFGAGSTSTLEKFLRAHMNGEKWIVAMTTSSQSAPLIIDGVPAMSMGGFNGNDKAMTPQKLAEYVKKGELRYVFAGGSGVRGNTNSATAKVPTACTEVPTSEWGGSTQGGFGGGSDGTLYDCLGKGDQLTP